MPKKSNSTSPASASHQSAGAVRSHARQNASPTRPKAGPNQNAHYDHAVYATDHGAVASLYHQKAAVTAAFDNAKHNTLLKAVKQQ